MIAYMFDFASIAARLTSMCSLTYPVVVDNLYNDGDFASRRTGLEEDDASNLNEAFECRFVLRRLVSAPHPNHIDTIHHPDQPNRLI